MFFKIALFFTHVMNKAIFFGSLMGNRADRRMDSRVCGADFASGEDLFLKWMSTKQVVSELCKKLCYYIDRRVIMVYI